MTLDPNGSTRRSAFAFCEFNPCRPKEKAAQPGAASHSLQVRLTIISPHPYLRRFGHGLVVARHISAPLSPCLTELPSATFCRLSPYQQVFDGILHFVNSSLHGFATHAILYQTIFKAITRDPRLGSQRLYQRKQAVSVTICKRPVSRRANGALKALHLIASGVSQLLIKKFLMKKIRMKKKRLAPSHLSEPLLVWPKSSEHRAPKTGRAV
jgi:hypothetical protein